jgi:hypothetical protein
MAFEDATPRSLYGMLGKNGLSSAKHIVQLNCLSGIEEYEVSE